MRHATPGGGQQRLDPETETLIPTIGGGFDVAHSLRGEGFDASEDGTGRGTPLVPVAVGADCWNGQLTGDVAATMGTRGSATTASGPTVLSFSAKDHGADVAEDLAPTLRAGGHANSHANAGVMPAVAWSIMPQNSGRDYKARPVEVAQPLMAGGPVGGNQGGDYIQSAMQVRRLTPRECARLQGFPDDYLDITYRGKPAADGPKYKALGNSWAVPVARWIGVRIAAELELQR